jgi:hypothetical protein
MMRICNLKSRHLKSLRSVTLVTAGMATSLLSPLQLIAQDEAAPPAAKAPAKQAPAAAPPAAVDPTGKKWKEDPIAQPLAGRSSQELARLRREIPGIERGDTTLDDNAKAVLDSYYGQFLFPQMTQTANLPKLVDARQNFRTRTMRNPFMVEAVHTHMNDLILKTMARISHDNGYHPAVRVNAMLMIADLNSKEPAAGGASSTGTPLAKALTERGGLLDSAGDTTLHPAVRAVAMLGVQRHADAGIAAGTQAAVQARMLAVLKEKATTPEASPGVSWVKARAANVLGTLAPAGGAAAPDLAAVLTDASSPVDLRCAAAKALGAQKGLAAGAIKLPEVVAALGNLHLDACREEIDRAAVEQDTVAARQVHFRSSAVQAALGDGKAGGIAALVPAGDAQKALVDGIVKNVAETLALVPDENADATAELALKANELEKLLADNKVLKSAPRATAAAAAPATVPATTEPAADAAAPAAKADAANATPAAAPNAK